jgi:hypothetical protein
MLYFHYKNSSELADIEANEIIVSNVDSVTGSFESATIDDVNILAGDAVLDSATVNGTDLVDLDRKSVV